MRPRTHALLVVVSFALLVASLWIPHRIGSQEELRAVRLGLPFRFAVQNQSLLTPPDFPRWHAFISPWNYPVRFDLLRMALSYACILGALEGAAAILARARAGRRATPPPRS
jgi:hypothetical protein